MDNAFERARAAYGTGAYDDATLEFLFPQLKENEDERIRMDICTWLKHKRETSTYPTPKKETLSTWISSLEKQKEARKAIEAVERIDKFIDEHLANAHDMKDSNSEKEYYLGWDAALGKMSGILQDVYSGEKQKEQPQEELVYRLNGLMQEYVKEGKDEAEKEHRFKCYHLFWDALEDANFFEQKEQKPADDKAFEKWIDDWWKHNKVNNPDSYDKGDEIQFDKRGFKNFCRGIRNMYAEQKLAWSEEDEKIYNKALDAIYYKDLNDKYEVVDALEALCDLISRKRKVIPPYAHWKPSEEQMGALLNIEGDLRAFQYNDKAKIIAELYEQLKRL